MKIFQSSVLKSMCLLVVMSSSLNADNTASTSVSVSGDIIASLSITSVEPIKFGEIARAVTSDSVAGTGITMDITDQDTGAFRVTYDTNSSPDVSEPGTGTENIPASGNRSIIAPGVINVSGEANYNYVATIDNGGVMAGGTTAGLEIAAYFTSFGDTTSNTKVIGVGGTSKIYVGGQLSATKNFAPVGAIDSGTVNVVVTYD